MQSIALFPAFSCTIFSRESDSTKRVSHFGGTVTITNKGISTIPNLTSGKLALLINNHIGDRLNY